jgi:hypothetical protein
MIGLANSVPNEAPLCLSIVKPEIAACVLVLAAIVMLPGHGLRVACHGQGWTGNMDHDPY